MVENARRLALQTTASSVIPALKDSTGEWRRSAGEKANVFAKTFAEKFILPGMTPNEYSELQFIRPRATGQQVSADSAHRVLMKLNEDSATGPDLLPTRILKVCADALCDPVSQLVQSILRWGQWPSAWRLHWIVPLHKKKSIYDAGNYRGVHLTPQISKVAERMLLVSVQQVIEDQCLFGENQFAYTKGKGSRDALAMLVMTWIASLNKNRKVAIFCSDVKGAFDHVRLNRMTEKLEATGLPRDIVQVLVSWLAQRDAQVIVEGDFSEKMCLSNMVFQGTVLGPILWNLFSPTHRSLFGTLASATSYSQTTSMLTASMPAMWTTRTLWQHATSVSRSCIAGERRTQSHSIRRKRRSTSCLGQILRGRDSRSSEFCLIPSSSWGHASTTSDGRCIGKSRHC